jgi:adenosylhomocysteine nucleosidase
MSRVAIVAALEREVRPLIRKWRASEGRHEARSFRFFENDQDDVVLVCGGMGAEAARRAAEAVIAIYAPKMIYSAGFAGALNSSLKAGEVVEPRRVVNASDGSSVSLAAGDGVLVSFASVASPAQKAKLRDAFAAQAVDMEAAAVARAAEARGVEFAAVKAISDDSTFNFPSLERFADSDGQFLEARFMLFAAIRPWLWPQVARLASNSRRASRALCDRLQKLSLNPVSASAEACEAVHRQ